MPAATELYVSPEPGWHGQFHDLAVPVCPHTAFDHEHWLGPLEGLFLDILAKGDEPVQMRNVRLSNALDLANVNWQIFAYSFERFRVERASRRSRYATALPCSSCLAVPEGSTDAAELMLASAYRDHPLRARADRQMLEP